MLYIYKRQTENFLNKRRGIDYMLDASTPVSNLHGENAFCCNIKYLKMTFFTSWKQNKLQKYFLSPEVQWYQIICIPTSPNTFNWDCIVHVNGSFFSLCKTFLDPLIYPYLTWSWSTFLLNFLFITTYHTPILKSPLLLH